MSIPPVPPAAPSPPAAPPGGAPPGAAPPWSPCAGGAVVGASASASAGAAGLPLPAAGAVVGAEPPPLPFGGFFFCAYAPLGTNTSAAASRSHLRACFIATP